MSSRVARRPRALTDLAEIWSYIAENSVARADTLADQINTRLQLLAGQPKMGRARPELGADLRSFPVDRYVVFYLPLRDGIDVIRVLHGARDIEAIFQNEEPM